VPIVHRRKRLARTAGVAALLVAAPLLASCGGSANASGAVTLNFYSFPDNSGAVQQAVTDCTKASGGKYVISYNKLPSAADGQRDQLVRRLAAHFSGVDIMGLDVTWESEFANAGWILPWTGANKSAAENGTLQGPLNTAIVNGQLYAVPYNSNTELLWYRSDLVPTPPTTWSQMIADSEKLAAQGKPHLIEIQGAQYEGAVVWFNTLLASAGGSVLTPDDKHVSLGAPAVKALSIIQQLAHSSAADPSLSVQMEDQNRLAMESGTAAFELNYPFVYPSMKADDGKTLFKSFKWAPYPSVNPGQPAKVTLGGIDLAVSKYSKHPSMAFQASLCLRNAAHQKIAATEGGLPPTLASVYDDPSLQAAYPFRALIKTQIENGSVRPKTPVYQSLSIAMSHLLSPPNNVSAVSTEKTMVSQLNDALQSKGLIP
jgi:multiple sugar transport system substrate-binding protein